jgi:hypothetical protein
MSEKRTIKAKEFSKDIRSGVTDAELMHKYGLTINSLHRIFSKLVDACLITEEEIKQRQIDSGDASDWSRHRGMQRNYVFVQLPIYDMDDILTEGLVVDITERGLQVDGISSEIGDKKSFLIQADYFADVYPFSFDVLCRWVNSGSDDFITAGYEITNISEGGLEQLKKLIRMLSLRI